IAATSNPPVSQAARMALAAAAGITPAAASAAASAASTSSIARSQASSDTAAAIAGTVRLGPNSRSAGKEDGLPLPLQPDVEAERAALVPGHQGGAALRLHQRHDGVRRVRRRLVGEVQAGHHGSQLGP